MFGRSCWCLFILTLAATQAAFAGQSAAERRAVAPVGPPPVYPVIPGVPRTPAVINLPQMVHAAGMIFSGRVLRVARDSTGDGFSLETLAITFHVDHALRGAATGRTLTIHEWAGEWSSGQRYRAGERVLLFLYPPSKLGLTSCVAGAMGRFHIDGQDRILLSGQHLEAFAHDPVLGGESRVSLDEFAQAVRNAGGEE